MRYICTYFDKNYLPRGLALIESLERHSNEFICYILALDKYTFDYLSGLEKSYIIPISIEEYGQYFTLEKLKYKDKKEFFFSLTPGFCLYLLKNREEVDLLLYLDADVCLFNNIEYLYDEIGLSSIAICPHRLPVFMKLFSTNYGVYNVGVNAFRKDATSVRCLEDWHRDCSNWHQGMPGYSLPFFSDQIWLDSWPDKYPNLKIIDHIGIDTAPWNAINYKFKKMDNTYFVNNRPLIIYHFASIKKIDNNVWTGNTGSLLININDILLEIYQNYIVKIDLDNDLKSAELGVSGSRIKKIIYSLSKIFFNDKIYLDHKCEKS
jgi:hypothetical protein